MPAPGRGGRHHLRTRRRLANALVSSSSERKFSRLSLSSSSVPVHPPSRCMLRRLARAIHQLPHTTTPAVANTPIRGRAMATTTKAATPSTAAAAPAAAGRAPRPAVASPMRGFASRGLGGRGLPARLLPLMRPIGTRAVPQVAGEQGNVSLDAVVVDGPTSAAGGVGCLSAAAADSADAAAADALPRPAAAPVRGKPYVLTTPLYYVSWSVCA